MNNKLQSELIKKLDIFLHIVQRLHGKHHKEIYVVKKNFEEIKSNIIKNDLSRTKPTFEKIRKLTNNYEVPNDVCESYEAIYKMLEELEKIYR